MSLSRHQNKRNIFRLTNALTLLFFLFNQAGFSQDLTLLTASENTPASETKAPVVSAGQETLVPEKGFLEGMLPNPLDFFDPPALSPAEESSEEKLASQQEAVQSQTQPETNSYDYERYEFEDAILNLQPEVASAVIVKSLNAEDLKKLTELPFETALIVLHGEIVLFTSGNEDEISMTGPAGELLAQASFVSHIHTAREIQEGPSPYDIREAVEAPEMEYVVTAAGFFAYNRNGAMNETPYSLEDYLARLGEAVLKSHESQDQIAARAALNEFIRQMDLYNQNRLGQPIFRKGGVVADLMAGASIALETGAGSSITGGFDGNGDYHFEGTRADYVNTVFTQTQTLGVQATHLQIKYKSTTAIGSGTVILTTASGNYSAGTFFQNTNGAEQTLLFELPHDFSLNAGDILKIEMPGSGQVGMTFTDIVYIDNVRPLATVQMKLGSAASEVTHVREVTLATTDINGNRITEMRVSMDNGRTWGNGWETYQATKRVMLPEGEGLKGVLVETRDASGNTYRTSDTITYRAIPAYVPTQAVTGNIFTNASSVSTVTNGSSPIANQGYTPEGWYFFNGTRRLGTNSTWVQSIPLNASGKTLRIRYNSSTVIGWSTLQMGSWSQNIFLYNSGGKDDEVLVYLPQDAALNSIGQFTFLTNGPDGPINLTIKEITLASVSLVTPLVTSDPLLSSLQFYRNGVFEMQNLPQPLLEGINHFDFTFGAQSFSVDMKLKGIDLISAMKPKPGNWPPYGVWPHSWNGAGSINGSTTVIEYDQLMDLRGKVIRISYTNNGGTDSVFTFLTNEGSFRSDTTFYSSGSEYFVTLPNTNAVKDVGSIRLDANNCYPTFPCLVNKVDVFDAITFGGSVIVTRPPTYSFPSQLFITSPAQLALTRNRATANDRMSFSINGGPWSAPVPFQSTWTLDLPGDNGQREIRYKLINEWGQEFISKDVVFVDGTVPVGTMKINGGANYAYDRNVTLSLEGYDGGSGLYQMQFSTDEGATWSNWEEFKTTKQLTLPDGDGLKIIYARYRDKAGNVMPLEQPVILSVPLPFNGWAMRIEDKTGIFSYDILYKRFSETEFTVVQSDFPVSGTGITTWVDDGSVTHHDPGIFAVRVNRRATPIAARITLNTMAPSGALSITNNGGNYLTSLTVGETVHHVQLDLSSIRDRNGNPPSLMQFKTSAGTPWDENWMAFQNSAAVDLSPAAGKRIIYGRVKDSAGNISEFMDSVYGTVSDYLTEVDLDYFTYSKNTYMVEPYFGFPFDRYNTRNDSQPTHLGFYALLLANVASGQIVTDKISKESAVAALDYFTKNLLTMQNNQYNSQTNPNGISYKGLLPWIDFDINTGKWKRKAVSANDYRGQTVDVRDNSNLTVSLAAAIGSLADTGGTVVRDIRNRMETFIANQETGYESLYTANSQGEFLMRNYDYVRNVYDANPYDYFGDEFRGGILFVALRYGLPLDVYSFLKLNMRKYTAQNGSTTYTASPWNGGAFQMLWPMLTMPEQENERLNLMLQNFVSIALDFSYRTDQPGRIGQILPGFLSAAYERQGSNIRYNDLLGISQIKSNPATLDELASSLYALGAAHAIAPSEINKFLEVIIAAYPQLITTHGLWEGYDLNPSTVVQDQVAANVMTFILGMAGTGAANMTRYLTDHQLNPDDAQPIAEDSDMIATANSYPTTPARDSKDGFAFGTGSCGDTTDSEPDSDTFRVKYTWANSSCTVGVAFRHEVTPLDASGQHLRIHYKSGSSLALSGAALEFKEYWAYPDDSASKTHIKLNIKDLKFNQTSTCLPGSANCNGEFIDIDLPSTISFNGIHQVTLVIPPQAAGQSLDLELVDFDFNFYESSGSGGGGGERSANLIDSKAPAVLAVINHGEPISRSSTVALDVLASDDSGIDQYRILRGENDDPIWEDFISSQEISFDDGEGIKNLRYQIRDKAGNRTEKNISVMIDHTAPVVNPKINGSFSVWTNQETVKLELGALDELAGVSQMRFSPDGVTWNEADWEVYASEKEFQFSGDGPKRIFFQILDRAGNMAEGSKDFILDTVPPSAAVSLSGNAAYVNSREITLVLSAEDSGSGIDKVRYSPNDEWEDFSPVRKITLDAGDGPKMLVYQVLDKAGNFTEVTKEIILDTEAPVVNGIQLNQGHDYAGGTKVSVDFDLNFSPGLEYHYAIDHEKDWKDDWKPIDLNTGQGEVEFTSEGSKTVRVRLRDEAGNLSEIVYDDIFIDTQNPAARLEINGGAESTDRPILNLSIDVNDGINGSGPSQMRFSARDASLADNPWSAWTSWEDFSNSKTLNLSELGMSAEDGLKQVRVQILDRADHISSWEDSVDEIMVAPIAIRNFSDLQNMNQRLDGNYYLADDIDLSSVADFAPIGSPESPFTGTLKGNGKIITGLTINRPGSDHEGLFSTLGVNAKIDGVKLENVSIVGQNWVGALAGYANGAVITNSSISGGSVRGQNFVGGLTGESFNGKGIRNAHTNVSVSGSVQVGGIVGRLSEDANHPLNALNELGQSHALGTVQGRDVVGGLVGYLFLAKITDSWVENGSVSGRNHVGGLVGESYNGNGISHSHSDVTVTGNDQVGGIVGRLWDGNINNLDRTYALGNVTGKTRVGGLVGYSKSGDMIRSYATGNVTAETRAGGLVGETYENAGIHDSYYSGGRVNLRMVNPDGSIQENVAGIIGGIAGLYDSYDDGISNVYFAGVVSLEDAAGGFIGTLNRHREITNNFWDTTLNPGLQDTFNAGSVEGITGKETNDMKNQGTYTGWDFIHTWHMGGYPRLGEDKTPPAGTLLINGGTEYTNQPHLSLSFNASEEIRYFEYSVDGGEWRRQNFQDPAVIAISSEEGEREIRVKLFDLAGNESEIYTDKIKLDLTPPRISFDLGETTVSFVQQFFIHTEDPVESLDDMCFTETTDSEGNPAFPEICGQSFFNQARWTLSPGYGDKKLFLRVHDKAGNETITFDEVRVVDNHVQADASLKAKDITQLSFPEGIHFLGTQDGRMVYADSAGNGSVSTGVYSLPLSPIDLSEIGDEWVFGLKSPETGTHAVNLFLASEGGIASFNLHSLSQEENIYAISKAKILEQAIDFDFLNVYSISFQAFPNAGTPGRMAFYFQPDRTPPAGSITINNGDAYALSPAVTLALTAADDILGASESGVSDVRFSFDGNFSECENNSSNEECWQVFSQVRNFTLPPGDGVKKVYYQIRDTAGNLSAVFEDSIVLDTAPPVIEAVSINSGADFTNSRTVTLNVKAKDGTSGVSKMEIFDGEKWLAAEDFSSPKTMMLPDSDGLKTVKVRVIDAAGLVSAESSALITLDRIPPAVVITSARPFTRDRVVSPVFTVTDSGSGFQDRRFPAQPGVSGDWNSALSGVPLGIAGAEGLKTFQAEVRDKAGNVSTSSFSIYYGVAPYLNSLKREPSSVPALWDMIRYIRQDLLLLLNNSNHDKWVKTANNIAASITQLPVYNPIKPDKYVKEFNKILLDMGLLYGEMPVF